MLCFVSIGPHQTNNAFGSWRIQQRDNINGVEMPHKFQVSFICYFFFFRSFASAVGFHGGDYSGLIRLSLVQNT